MDEHKSVRENWKEMDTKQRISYYKEYFLLPTLFVLMIAVTLILAIGQTIFRGPEIVMHAFIYKDILDDTAEKEAMDALAEKIGVDPDAIYFDDGHEDTEVGGMQLASLISMGEIDLVVCRREMYEQLAGQGMLVDLETVFDEKLMEKYSDMMVSAAGYEEPELTESGEETWEGYGKAEPLPYGVRISDSQVYADLSLTDKEYYCCIIADGKHQENAVCCLKYLMGAINE